MNEKAKQVLDLLEAEARDIIISGQPWNPTILHVYEDRKKNEMDVKMMKVGQLVNDPRLKKAMLAGLKELALDEFKRSEKLLVMAAFITDSYVSSKVTEVNGKMVRDYPRAMDDPDHTEALVVSYSTKDKSHTMAYPYDRQENGTVVFSEPHLNQEPEKAEGLFTELFPDELKHVS